MKTFSKKARQQYHTRIGWCCLLGTAVRLPLVLQYSISVRPIGHIEYAQD